MYLLCIYYCAMSYADTLTWVHYCKDDFCLFAGEIIFWGNKKQHECYLRPGTYRYKKTKKSKSCLLALFNKLYDTVNIHTGVQRSQHKWKCFYFAVKIFLKTMFATIYSLLFCHNNNMLYHLNDTFSHNDEMSWC